MSDVTKSLLIVDDDAFIVELVTSVAEGEGYEVGAADSPDTLAACLERRWSVTLLDLTMPDLDAVTALRMIADAQPGSEILVFSGAEEERVRSATTVAGFYGLTVIGSLAKGQGLPALQEILRR